MSATDRTIVNNPLVGEDEEEQPVIVAQVRVATELYGDELEALQRWLEQGFGSPLRIDLIQDPTILGGVWVRVKDVIIDGSLRGKLEQLRHHLAAQCRVMISNNMAFYQPENRLE